MGRIVAAPTAGSCGILPGLLFAWQETRNGDEDAVLNGLIVAAAVGQIIANRATLAGASGGCQAEIGTASAMAAAALVSLKGGSSEMIAQAVAIALSNLMGLVCDPVAGLVEVPCVKRNVIGAMNAISAADMALAGIECIVPVDEVIEAMGDVGRQMPVQFRETALGGLADTPTGRAVKERMQSQGWT
jgi:L-serine dehydratase